MQITFHTSFPLILRSVGVYIWSDYIAVFCAVLGKGCIPDTDFLLNLREFEIYILRFVLRLTVYRLRVLLFSISPFMKAVRESISTIKTWGALNVHREPRLSKLYVR